MEGPDTIRPPNRHQPMGRMRDTTGSPFGLLQWERDGVGGSIRASRVHYLPRQELVLVGCGDQFVEVQALGGEA